MALVEAMRQHGRVAHIARLADPSHPKMAGNQVLLPHPLFRDAATNWGVAQPTKESDDVIRQHGTYMVQDLYPSLPWVVARMAGAQLDLPAAVSREERWLRYYGPTGAWTRLSYHFATNQAPGFFRDKIVFIGSRPKTPVLDGEDDEFRTPYTNWTGQSAGGMEIMATTFLNLVNRDWLRRLPWWQEVLVLMLIGTLMGAGFSLLRWPAALSIGLAATVVVALAGICLSHYTNWWFPWLVVGGGQIPVAVGWTCLAGRKISRRDLPTETAVSPQPVAGGIASDGLPIPVTPDFKLFQQIGKGGFGRVWLVRDAVGRWKALKAIYAEKFEADSKAYETEFKGVERYAPVSDKQPHPGLLRVEFVSARRPEGYFYYVMQLGDALVPGWEEKPELYKALNLEEVCKQRPGKRLPVVEAAQIIVPLAEALQCLHDFTLVHRDIKPSNIVFVDKQPKLADVGCVGEARLPKDVTTWIGTLGYMPPHPEPPGTKQADVYALGKVLYVISTGRAAPDFPELSETLVEQTGEPEFMRLNPIILNACEPDCRKRYASAAELAADLRKLLEEIGG